MVLRMGVVICRWMHVQAVGRRISTKQSDSLATIKESLVLICIDNIGSCHCHLKEAAGAAGLRHDVRPRAVPYLFRACDDVREARTVHSIICTYTH